MNKIDLQMESNCPIEKKLANRLQSKLEVVAFYLISVIAIPIIIATFPQNSGIFVSIAVFKISVLLMVSLNFFPLSTELEFPKKSLSSDRTMPSIVQYKSKKKWFQQEAKSLEHAYFLSLFFAQDDAIKREHFEKYRREDTAFIYGNFKVTKGAPWEEFALKIQKEMQSECKTR